MSWWWNLKYELTKCRCKGNPAKCDHTKHLEFVSGGSQTSFDFRTGEIGFKSHQDPAWQCAGCGFPIRPTYGWDQKAEIDR